MNKLINRKVLISMIFIGLTMMGLFSYRYLLMELYPLLLINFPPESISFSVFPYIISALHSHQPQAQMV